MTGPADSPTDLVTGPTYYRSFASYEIPFRPVDPVPFAGTEGLRSFYVAYHDPAGRVVRFDKVQCVRASKDVQTLPMSGDAAAGSAVYFAAVADPSSGAVRPGGMLGYGGTEDRGEFFAGVVGPTGNECTVTRMRRDVAFTDRYEYWPNGRLRSRVKSGPNQEPAGESYDDSGNRVSVTRHEQPAEATPGLPVI